MRTDEQQCYERPSKMLAATHDPVLLPIYKTTTRKPRDDTWNFRMIPSEQVSAFLSPASEGPKLIFV